MTIAETASNIWGFFGIGIAVLGTIIVSVINTRSAAAKKESEKIKELSKKVELLETEFKSLKDSFTLVCDEMDRNGTMTPQLNHFRKLFDL